MKKSNNIIINIIIIVAVIVVLGVMAAVVAVTHSRKATFKQDFQIEEAAQPGRLTKIYMADKENNELLLTYVGGDEGWLVDNQWPASSHLIDLMLETLSKMRIRSQVNKAAVPNIIKQMAAKSIKVEVYYNDYRIKWFGGKLRLFPYEKCRTFYVGHDTQDMLGTYMYREGDDVPYVIHIPGFRGCLLPRFIVDPLAWRSHKIVDLPVQQIASIELDIPSMPEESFAVVRDGDGFAFQLLNPPQRVNGFDSLRVGQLLSSFVHLNFDEYARAVPKAELDTTFSRAPRTILRITDIDGNSREVKTYIKYSNPDDVRAMPDTTMYQVFDLNRLYAIIDNKDTVLIQYYSFDNILQPASFFLGKDKSAFAR